MTPDEIATLKRNLAETSSNESSHELACRLADCAKLIDYQEAIIDAKEDLTPPEILAKRMIDQISALQAQVEMLRNFLLRQSPRTTEICEIINATSAQGAEDKA